MENLRIEIPAEMRLWGISETGSLIQALRREMENRGATFARFGIGAGRNRGDWTGFYAQLYDRMFICNLYFVPGPAGGWSEKMSGGG